MAIVLLDQSTIAHYESCTFIQLCRLLLAFDPPSSPPLPGRVQKRKRGNSKKQKPGRGRKPDFMHQRVGKPSNHFSGAPGFPQLLPEQPGGHMVRWATAGWTRSASQSGRKPDRRSSRSGSRRQERHPPDRSISACCCWGPLHRILPHLAVPLPHRDLHYLLTGALQAAFPLPQRLLKLLRQLKRVRM